MKISRKTFLRSLGVLIGIGLLVSISFYTYQGYLTKKYSGFLYYTGKAKIDSYEFIADGQGVIVHWDPVESEKKELHKYNEYLITEWRNPTSRHYVLRDNMKLPKHPSDIHETVRKDAYWTLSMYKVEGNRLKEEPEIDLLATVDQYKKGYISNDLGPVFSYKGKDYLTLYVRPLKEWKNEKKVFLNLQTRKVEEVVALESMEDPLPQTEVNVKDFSELGIKDSILDINQFVVEKKTLKTSPISKDRKAMSILEKENSTIIVLNNMNTIDFGPRLVSVYPLFYPKGYSPTEYLYIPKELSVDGQDHDTKNKQEFDQYYDIDKAKQLYHLTD
ncbi:hypothetical protein LXO72_03855 [Streptococcus sp. XMC]|uniref:hypothetical protein n=1 Tax=Streptococcus sp. XMC TaxID=2905972 RepID=UPI0012B6EB7D|nr:hypothetical protein [Streptococcus sp. XMC]MCE3591525.1 hypothetical protein [Streptococcus sp. XMC]